MKNFWNRPWVISIISLFFAILIVMYVDASQTGFLTQGESNRTRQTATERQSVKVPLQVSVDTDQYYVTGYPEKVKVTLEGSSALVTSALNTQSFRAYIDLTSLDVGNHTVKVRISGLSNQISYSIEPATVKVNIQRRKSRTMPVQLGYNKNVVAKGYTIGNASVNPAQVEVTGAISEVDQIDQIVAHVALPNNLDHTYERQVMLVAEDKRGRQLNVVIQPTIARVSIPVSATKKTVKLNLSSHNEADNRVYALTARQHEITIYGSKSDLAKIKSVNLDVDLKQAKTSYTQTYRIPLPKGVVKMEPDSVEVQVAVKETVNSK